MARNGSGTYSNPYPNFVSGTVISSTEVDTNNSQIATALTQSIAVDGQSVVTGDIPLATHKFTAMKVGTASTDSLSLGQAQAEAFVWCGTAGGGADAITLSPSPAITAYAAGQRFVWMASGSTNTTATTVAISGLGAIALQDNGAALTAGQHAAGKMFMGILNTTSTVQIMQVQVSGNDIINGNTQFNGTITVGVNDTGHDVTFYGATSGAYMLWDESADDLLLVGAAGLNVAGSTVLASVDVTAVATAATFEPDGDTSAGDNAALGYTSVLGAILTGQGSTNDVTLVNDADATVLGIPTGTTNVTMAGTLAVTGGITGATSINNGQIGGRRNLVDNGAMQVSQRGTSEASVTTSQYANAPDRFKVSGNNGTWTISQDTNAPAGFSTSFKMLLTATETIGGTSYWMVQQYIESQNLQHLAYGTSSAKTVTVSFYVKSNVTGAYCLNLYQESDAGAKNFPKTYTINSADTWEYKTISYVGDTATALDNDNTSGLRTQFFVVAGSTYTSGSAGSRGDYTNGTFAAGQAVQVDAVDDYWQITGVQLEVGTTATDFESRSYGEELATCQRYLYVLRADTDDKGMGLTGQAYSTTVAIVPIVFPVTPRAKITGIETTGADHFALTVAASSRQESTGVAFGSGGLDGIWLSVTVAANLVAGNATTLWSANANASIFFTGAEL